MKTNLQNLMREAWKMARNAAAKFGGRSAEYFAQSLKLCWENVKEATMEIITRIISGGRIWLHNEYAPFPVHLAALAGVDASALAGKVSGGYVIDTVEIKTMPTCKEIENAAAAATAYKAAVKEAGQCADAITALEMLRDAAIAAGQRHNYVIRWLKPLYVSMKGKMDAANQAAASAADALTTGAKAPAAVDVTDPLHEVMQIANDESNFKVQNFLLSKISKWSRV